MENTTLNNKRRTALRRYVRTYYDIKRSLNALRARPVIQSIDIPSQDQFTLSEREAELAVLVAKIEDDIAQALKHFSFYRDVLSDPVRYKGISRIDAATIIGEFDITCAAYPSQFWSFAGIGAAYQSSPEAPYVGHSDAEDPSGGQADPSEPKASPGYNTFLKTMLVKKLADKLLHVGSPWQAFYYTKLADYELEGWGSNAEHRHRGAARYMLKMLLVDIWYTWRVHEGYVGSDDVNVFTDVYSRIANWKQGEVIPPSPGRMLKGTHVDDKAGVE